MPEPSTDDEQLLARLRQGDEEAFVSLYRRWQGGIFRFALHMTGSRAVAEDVTQDVFMTLIEGALGFDPERGRLPGYLYGIARNKALRRMGRERLLTPLDDDRDDGGLTSPDASDPLQDVEQEERVGMVRDAVLALPTHYRETVVLCDLHELAYEEAADALQISIGTVRSRLHRGRALLRKKLRSLAGTATALRARSIG